MTALEMATEEIDGLFTRMERNLGAMREQVDGCKALREGVLRDVSFFSFSLRRDGGHG